jgi:NAD(P)-dependent dehydrogenase (short-subunit alcohol dehydrogenase family)
MLLQDKVALITGSGRGIGRAMATLFAQEGARVFLTARTGSELSAVAEDIASAGGVAAFVTADLTREDDCTRVAAAAREKFGRVDILSSPSRNILSRNSRRCSRSICVLPSSSASLCFQKCTPANPA